MIKFFRTIRQKLINEGNMKRYLIYAIGEILLVMVGILLALQVNNRNEIRKNNAKEQKVLNELLAELEINGKKIEQQVLRLKENIELHRAYIQKMVRGELNIEIIEELHHGNRLTVGTVNPSFGVINTILSTGDIMLIRDDSLRNSLSNWKDVLIDYAEDEQYQLDFFFRELHPFIRGKFLMTKSEGDSLAFYDINRKELENNYLLATKSTKYRSLIIDNLEWLNGNMNSNEGTLKTLRSLIERIELSINE